MSDERRGFEVLLPMVPAGAMQQEDACTEDCCAPSNEASSTCADDCCSAEIDTGIAAPEPARVPDDATRTVVRVTGMDCASCAVTIEKRVGQLPGVHRATVNFAAGRLDAEHGDNVKLDDLERAVERAGYSVERPGESEHASFWSQPSVRLTLAGSVLFAIATVLWLVDAPEALSAAGFLAATAVGGLPIYRSALKSAATKTADVNVLMSIAVIGAAAIGAWSEAALVVILFSVSNALQVYAVGRTRGAVRALARLAPDEVLIQRGDRQIATSAQDVAVGAIVVIRPGERVALDGEVLEGSSALDESPVTGESTPAEKGKGEPVFSGSLNGQGSLLVRVTKAASNSTLQRITRMVEDAQGTRAPIEQFVDRFARIYTPVVMVAAVLVATVPLLFSGDFSTWFYRALVLLIVSCPCALVISTPVSVVSGIGAASRRGILVKGGKALEAAGKLSTLFFDKTGTLTEGRPVVERVIAVRDIGRDEAIALAAALERRSEHPLAHAILTAAGDAELPAVADFTSVTGRGARGTVGDRLLFVGSPRLFDEQGIALDAVQEELAIVDEAGETPVVLGDEQGALAVFGLADAIRPDAARALDALREAGVERLVMLTGDAEAPARRIADQLGIDYRARLLPEDKVAAIRELALDHGTTGMVGDGINDAPALAAADVSFAMGAAGTDAALEAADVALMADYLSKVAEAVQLSRRAERTIKQNIVASIFFNTLFTVLAPFGFVPLWLAVLEDAVTSVGVTGNSLRLFGRRGRQ